MYCVHIIGYIPPQCNIVLFLQTKIKTGNDSYFRFFFNVVLLNTSQFNVAHERLCNMLGS